ncbi:amino acid permease C-terminal domain-containing protein [Candidatus Mycobacterium methanotrophicum]
MSASKRGTRTERARLWLMVSLTVVTWIRFGVWMVAGVAIYFG